MTRILFTLEKGLEPEALPYVDQVGGKGHGLYWLKQHGFPIPGTWVLSAAAYDLVIEQAGLGEIVAQIEKFIAGVKNDWSATQRALDRLEPQRAELIEGLRSVAMPEQVGSALEDLVFMPTQWAVRSSATVGDNPLSSFAGQFQSLLSAPGGLALWGAIRQVWASTCSREALTYCAQKGVSLPRMAIVLQPMQPITAQDRSGLVFSHSPTPTLPGVLIRVAFGAGHVVVGGQGGDLYGVQGGKVQIQPMRPAHIQVTGPDGDMVPHPPPPGFALTAQQARELAELVLAVSEKWGGPVNVEFVWRAGGMPELVQVRSAMSQPVAAEATTA